MLGGAGLHQRRRTGNRQMRIEERRARRRGWEIAARRPEQVFAVEGEQQTRSRSPWIEQRERGSTGFLEDRTVSNAVESNAREHTRPRWNTGREFAVERPRS